MYDGKGSDKQVGKTAASLARTLIVAETSVSVSAIQLWITVSTSCGWSDTPQTPTISKSDCVILHALKRNEPIIELLRHSRPLDHHLKLLELERLEPLLNHLVNRLQAVEIVF